MVRAHQRVVALHRSYLQRLVRAHEEERTRVAREVHDDAVQRLVHLGRELELQVAEATSDASGHRRLTGIHEEVEDLADALRQLAHGLHPAALEQAGLTVALVQLADETGRLQQLDVELLLPEHDPVLDPEVRLALFRITQEALRNTARHGGTTRARVELRAADGIVHLIVEDAGAGFDQLASRPRGIGLVGIEERARLAGGEARVESSPGAGTRVSVTVPASGRR
jgi:signal transduction histidine kinase